jgi:hypothetical protein
MTTTNIGERPLEKCVACHYYDRNDARVEDKGVRWGKCRRTGPVLHPLSAKAYMVEGIWPSVRDDDWCGEWTVAKRKGDAVSTDPRHLLMQGATANGRPAVVPGSLMTPLPTADDAPMVKVSGLLGSD